MISARTARIIGITSVGILAGVIAGADYTATHTGQPAASYSDSGVIAAPSQTPVPNPLLAWTCQPHIDPSDGWNDQDAVTVQNLGTVPVAVSSWTVSYTDAAGDTVGTDAGNAPGSDPNADTVRVNPGQVLTVTDDTGTDSLSTDLTTYTSTSAETSDGMTNVTVHGTTDAVACSVTNWNAEPAA